MRKERALKRDGVIKDEHFTHQAEIEIPLLATMCNTVIDNSETLCELKDKVKIMQDYIKWSKVN
jgi:dephospho-CoA kinase